MELYIVLNCFFHLAYQGWLSVTAGISTSFCLMAEYYSIGWIYNLSFIHSSNYGHFSCFYFLATINTLTMNICVQDLYMDIYFHLS